MSIFNFFKPDQTRPNNTSEKIFKEKFDEVKTSLTEVAHKDSPFFDSEYSYLQNIHPAIISDFDPKKETIVLIDDNPGVISFLVDDLKALKKARKFDYTKYNILSFDTKLAAFKLRALLMTQPELNIKYGIFDITLGGTLYTETGENICLDGVDSFIDVSEQYPDVNYIFYTGNKLNTYIKKNQEVVDKFTRIMQDDINNHILFKTKYTISERREYLLKFFSQI